MKKTITIFGVLALAGSSVLSLNALPYKTQNLQNILQSTIAKSNVTVNNDIVTQIATSDYFYFQARLSNSTYNGFPGFMDQIAVFPYTIEWALFFFQWLDDNNFSTSQHYLIEHHFPDLNKFTEHGFFHNPITWSNRLDEHMGHFGSWRDNKTDTAYNMIRGWDPNRYLIKFGSTVEGAYNQAAKTGKVAGIDLNFGFTYSVRTSNLYTVAKPNFVIIMNQ